MLTCLPSSAFVDLRRYNPIKTIKTSFLGTMNMLGLAKRTHARFLLTSTSEVCQPYLRHEGTWPCLCMPVKLGLAALNRRCECAQVYGDPLEHPQTEKYWGNVNCIGERSCYDEGKRAAECLTFDYMREHKMEVWSVHNVGSAATGRTQDLGWWQLSFASQVAVKAPLFLFTMTMWSTVLCIRPLCCYTGLLSQASGVACKFVGSHMAIYMIGTSRYQSSCVALSG